MFSTILQSSLPAFCEQHLGAGTKPVCPCFLWGLIKSVNWEKEWFQWDISRTHRCLRSNASVWALGVWKALGFPYILRLWVSMSRWFTVYSQQEVVNKIQNTCKCSCSHLKYKPTSWLCILRFGTSNYCKGAKSFCSSLLKVWAKLL